MNKIKQIQNMMPENAEILVRTEGKNLWFIHYYLMGQEFIKASIYKNYTDNPDKALDDIIEIIKKE